METSDQKPEGRTRPTLLPQWSWLIGLVLFVGTFVFICRIVYESTFITCERGPQMVGFSIAHGVYPILLFAMLCMPVFFVWLVIALIYGAWRKLRFSKGEWALLGFMVASFSVLFIPYSAWLHVDALACGNGNFRDAFLVEAAADGDISIVKQLAAQGAGLDGASPRGVTPLGAAVANDRVEIVEFLISRGANVNFSTVGMGRTPLMIAAENGHLPIVKTLLAHGARPCAVDREQQTPLTLARQYKHQDIVEYLRSNFPCPDPPPPPPSSCKSESQDNCVEVH